MAPARAAAGRVVRLVVAPRRLIVVSHSTIPGTLLGGEGPVLAEPVGMHLGGAVGDDVGVGRGGPGGTTTSGVGFRRGP